MGHMQVMRSLFCKTTLMRVSKLNTLHSLSIRRNDGVGCDAELEFFYFKNRKIKFLNFVEIVQITSENPRPISRFTVI